ncbi:MAG: fibrobacter succinogenes major paralogous domain-containing protein, partial [Syntrophothermus sp.]
AGTGVHNLLYRYTNYYGCSFADTLEIRIINDPFTGCGNILMDLRDGRMYSTKQFGSRCWTTQNLNYGTMISFNLTQRDNCLPEKYCFDNNFIHCVSKGGLYQWDEIMRFESQSGTQGLCPPGWHVPDENDWNSLFSTYQNSSFAGSPLKFSGYSGFNALFAGAEFSNNTNTFLDFAGFFWTSSPHGPAKAWAHVMNLPDPSVSSYPSPRNNAFSVRCVKD